MKRSEPNCTFCACGDHAFAALSRWGVTLVSTEDAPQLADHIWTLHYSIKHKISYAYRKTGGRLSPRNVYLHSAIIGPTPGLVTDHRSGDGLDNRRKNLRVTDGGGNSANRRISGGTSRFKGVYWHRGDARWMARIKKDRKTVYLGSFTDEAAAAAAYDAAASELFGDMARLNFRGAI